MKDIRQRDVFHTRAKMTGELMPYFIGYEQCPPGHSWGPGIRDYFLVHYIKKGKGVFRADGREYTLSGGQLFFIFPENVSHYFADQEEPWEYYWVGFGGSRAAHFVAQAGVSQQNPTLKCREQEAMAQCLDAMLQNYDNHPAHRLRFTGLLYTFFSYLLDESAGPGAGGGSAEQYYNRAVEYIGQHYSHTLSVGELAAFIGIDRKYLYQIFKKTCQLSPEEYIIRFRMDKACELMGNDSLSISTIAHSVGYGDALLFSKMFKKKKGKSPSAYRKERQEPLKEAAKDGCGQWL